MFSEEVTARQAELLSSNRHMLLLEYYIYSDEIVGDGALPRLRVYANGSILVNFPPFMKAGGDYIAELGAEEISDICLQLASNTTSLAAAFSGREQPHTSGAAMLGADQVLENTSHQMLFKLVLHPPLFALDPTSRQTVNSPIYITWSEGQSPADSARTAEALITLNDITGLLDQFISRALPSSSA